MGVPAFFRWLTVRYPQVVIDALTPEDMQDLMAQFKRERKAQDPNELDLGTEENEQDLMQVYANKKIAENNPEIDNLYLDMNGIIHPCCHPVDKPQPKSEIEMFNLVFEYTDKVIDIVRPRKTIYMAIDGVAPRAKMNQQRSRRFRTALDAQEKAERESSIRNKWAEDGIKFTGRPTQSDATFDSNVITPGTEFMHNLSKALQLYIVERLHNRPGWKDLQVIFSDAFVPGEGEHKILDFIRSQRAQPEYNVNTSHCIYGADADLIMLGLSTHEPHFYILRESVEQDNSQQQRGQRGGGRGMSRGGHGGQHGHYKAENEVDQPKKAPQVKFQFCKIAVVREYLYLEFKDLKIPPNLWNFERIIDDFVFLCFLVGNDFLPHLPSLVIREGALDAIIFIYKTLLPSLGGYLTDGKGGLLRSNVDVFFNELSKVEEAFFKQHEKNAKFNEDRRKQDEQRDKDKIYEEMKRKEMDKEQAHQDDLDGIKKDLVKWRNEDKRDSGSKPELVSKPSEVELTDAEKKILNADQLETRAKRFLKNKLQGLSEQEQTDLIAKHLKEVVKKQVHEKQDKQVSAWEDKIQFTKEGWKERYYREKFLVRGPGELKEFCKNIRQAYIEGLEWVLQYYYNGCQSWYWYYPYHYAPFASDLLGCDQLTINFEIGEPAKPFEQLLAVFPKQSSHAVPECYRKLYDDNSEVIDFYPTEVKLDINGARYAWMGVNLLPFLDRERLKAAMMKADQKESLLKPAEKIRNKRTGDIRLFFNRTDTGKLNEIVEELKDGQPFEAGFKGGDQISGSVSTAINSSSKDLMFGKTLKKTLGELTLEIEKCQSCLVHFIHPKFNQHLTSLLQGVAIPKREVEDFAIYHTNRRVFRGEEAIKIVENVLGIDASQDPVYHFGGRTNTRGQDIGGYKNNHAVYQTSTDFQGAPQRMVGQRRSYQQYNSDNRNQGQDYNPQKRMNYGNGSNYGGGGPNMQSVNFNIRGGGAQTQAGRQNMQQPMNFQQNPSNVISQAHLQNTQNAVQAFGQHFQQHLVDQSGMQHRGGYQGQRGGYQNFSQRGQYNEGSHHQTYQNQQYNQNQGPHQNYRGRGQNYNNNMGGQYQNPRGSYRGGRGRGQY